MENVKVNGDLQEGLLSVIKLLRVYKKTNTKWQ